jgi:hypothetical protein
MAPPPAGLTAHTGGARPEDGRAAPGREAPPRAAHEASGTGLAKSAKLAKPARMRAGLLRTSLRFLTWVCVGLLGLLSLLPAQDMVRTGFPGPLEHFAAYAGSGAIAMAGYGLNRGVFRVIGGFWVYAGILEYLHISRPAGTRNLWISQHRHSGLCAADWPFSFSGAGAQLHWDRGTLRSGLWVWTAQAYGGQG